MREVFEFLSIFDWITPTIGFVQDIVNDPTPLQSNSWTFFVPYNQALGNGWNPANIERMLKQHGIKTWGGQLTNGEYFFSVKLNQAQWAEYLLQRNGIPLTELSMGAPRLKKKKRPPRKQRRQPNDDPLSFLDDFLNTL